MSAQVTLTVSRGALRGTRVTFTEPGTCVIGRASDANLRLPDDQAHRAVSRHHCLLDINPPDARVRDFGSRNGTWLNGTMIGRRGSDQTPQQAAADRFPEHDLRSGDELRVGETVLTITVLAPTLCMECEAEVPAAEHQAGGHRCESCRTQAGPGGAHQNGPRRCVACGADVSAEVGLRQGEALCSRCAASPDRALRHLWRTGTGTGAIAGYTIETPLGQGGMGAVYRARHDHTGKQVALKVMLPQVAAVERTRALFLRETATSTALEHPNIVRVHDYGCWNGIFYFAMEYCDGGDAAGLVDRWGDKPAIDEAVDLILQTLDGLAYAHRAEVPVTLADGHTDTARGLVHRDLSPHNILLHEGVAKVGDFGLAKAFDAAGLSGHTRTGAAAGKPSFLPRQQVIDFRNAKPEVDVWAAAACLYYLLTGSPPRDFSSSKDPWQVVLQDPPVPIRSRNRTVPTSLAAVIDHALTDRPAIGISTAAELRRLLQDARP